MKIKNTDSYIDLGHVLSMSVLDENKLLSRLEAIF